MDIIKILKYSALGLILFFWVFYSLSVLGNSNYLKQTLDLQMLPELEPETMFVLSLNLLIVGTILLFFIIKKLHIVGRILKILKKLAPLHYLLLAVFLLLIGAFYWFQIRPSQIKSFCFNAVSTVVNKHLQEGSMPVRYGTKQYDDFVHNRYLNCLHSQGL